MIEKQDIITIEAEKVLEKVESLFNDNYRLVQIGCTRIGTSLQVDYTFDKEYAFLNLRLILPLENAKLKSISGIYWCAFTYENELHDLFGIKIDGLNIDFSGNFYRKASKTPFITPADAAPGKENKG
ncbi:MAG: hypothetical protein A2017_04310 [Lentisphaerae bacterium GWF2_44_16]|nr:MAG: hypothetical protein A2017_04310 [Lentisphaerae bacterium GWF2_44_16]